MINQRNEVQSNLPNGQGSSLSVEHSGFIAIHNNYACHLSTIKGSLVYRTSQAQKTLSFMKSLQKKQEHMNYWNYEKFYIYRQNT